MRFEAVPPAQVGKWWDWVAQGVGRIKQLCGEEWRIEEIYRYLRNNQATLFLFWDGELPKGFAVIERCIDPATEKQYLNVWLLHFVNGIDESARADLLGFLDDTARRSGCKTVRFVSPREGWMRFLRGDFEAKSIIYERAVT